MKEIKEKIKDFLSSSQRTDGGFEDFSGREAMAANSLLLLFLLEKNEDEKILSIRKKSADFLLRYKSDDWVFSKDLGFNFLVLYALSEYDKEIFSGEALAKILLTLTEAEEKIGGPYLSVVDGEQKVDLFANIVIAGFLNNFEVQLSNLEEFFSKVFELQNFYSDQATDLLNIYFLSKFYKGSGIKKIIEKIFASRGDDGFWSDASADMLVFCSLINFGCLPDKESEEKYFSEVFLSSDLFLPFIHLKEINNADRVFGQIINSSLFLNITSKLAEDEKKSKENSEENREEEKMVDKILSLNKKRFSLLPDYFRNFANEQIEEVAKRNSDRQMLLMPYYFRSALGGKGEIFSDDFVAELGLHNAFFWTAFIIYDDFIDQEGDPKLISTANIYAREFTGFFRSIFPADKKFDDFFSCLMDKLDAANTWEALYCRIKVKDEKIIIPENLPDYKDYEVAYEPASAHILGSVAMLYKMGFSLESCEVKNLIEYFRHYLIAMQFNDDIYDWEEDLRRGQISTAVCALLNDWKKENPEKNEIDFKKDISEIRKIFCFSTMEKLSSEAIKHTQESQKALDKMDFLENKAPLEKFINLTQNASQKAFLEQKKTRDFLDNFKS